MAALFRQEFWGPPGSPGGARSRPASKGGKPPDGPAAAAATAPERLKQLKEAFAKVLAATGEAEGGGRAGGGRDVLGWEGRQHRGWPRDGSDGRLEG